MRTPAPADTFRGQHFLAQYATVGFRTDGAGTPSRTHPPTEVGPFQNLEVKGAVTTVAESEVKRPESWYADAAVVAFRLPENDQSMAALQPKVTSNGGNFDLAKLTDGDYANGMLLPPAPVGQKSWIQFEFQKPVTVYGMSMYLGDLNRGMMMRGGESSCKNLEASHDGKQLHAVSELPGGRMTIPDSRIAAGV